MLPRAAEVRELRRRVVCVRGSAQGAAVDDDGGALARVRAPLCGEHVLLSGEVAAGEQCGSPLLCIVKPSRSCHGYCLTAHVHEGGWSGR